MFLSIELAPLAGLETGTREMKAIVTINHLALRCAYWLLGGY